MLIGFQKSIPVADWLVFRGIVAETKAWSQLDWDRFKVSSCWLIIHSLGQWPENNLFLNLENRKFLFLAYDLFCPISIAYANASSWKFLPISSSLLIINKLPEKLQNFSFMVIEWLPDPEALPLFSFQKEKWRWGRNRTRRLLCTPLCPALCHMVYSLAERKDGDLDCWLFPL